MLSCSFHVFDWYFLFFPARQQPDQKKHQDDQSHKIDDAEDADHHIRQNDLGEATDGIDQGDAHDD